jgi:hypothetical protein
LKAKKEFSDEECSSSGSEDEEYALAVRNFRKFFRRKGRFPRQSRDEKKSSQRNHDERKGTSDRRCFRCGDPNHFIGECPKPPKSNNQRAFVGGSWSDSGEEEEKKLNDETCLMAQASNEVHSDSSYYSDNNSSVDDSELHDEYNKLCVVSTKILGRNTKLKLKLKELELQVLELNDQVKRLEKNKEVDLGCGSCISLQVENEKLKENALRIIRFDEGTKKLNDILENIRYSEHDRSGLGFDPNQASTSSTKQVKFVMPEKSMSEGDGTIKDTDGTTKFSGTVWC